MGSVSKKTKVDMKYNLMDTTTEPSDEQLSQLMKEVAKEAKLKSEKTKLAFFHNMQEYIRLQKDHFLATRINLNNA